MKCSSFSQKAYIFQQIGPTDCSIIGNVYNCIKSCKYSQLLELDNLYYCMRLIEETRYASTNIGIQLLRCVSSFIRNDDFINYYLENIKNGHAKGVYPVSFALSCNSMNIKKEIRINACIWFYCMYSWSCITLGYSSTL